VTEALPNAPGNPVEIDLVGGFKNEFLVKSYPYKNGFA
jgi:hypothetical protein